jgi:hypothetical protein
MDSDAISNSDEQNVSEPGTNVQTYAAYATGFLIAAGLITFMIVMFTKKSDPSDKKVKKDKKDNPIIPYSKVLDPFQHLV